MRRASLGSGYRCITHRSCSCKSSRSQDHPPTPYTLHPTPDTRVTPGASRPMRRRCDSGHPRPVSSSVNDVKAKPTLRHSTPPTAHPRPLCHTKSGSSGRAYSRIVVRAPGGRFTRSVEFPKVALLAHGKRTRPRWTAAATATAETCSRDLNLSTLMTSARRSLGSLRRLRDLSWNGGAQLSSRCVESH